MGVTNKDLVNFLKLKEIQKMEEDKRITEEYVRKIGLKLLVNTPRMEQREFLKRY